MTRPMELMSGSEWDARAEIDLAILIERYLIERPPPAGAVLPDDLRRWAARLKADGQVALAGLGGRRLTQVSA